MTARRLQVRADEPGSDYKAPAEVCQLDFRRWLGHTERYGKIIHMKKTLHIDEKLLQEARIVSRAATDTETVRMGLEALIRHAANERIRALRGADPAARDVPRRREKSARKRRGA